MHKYLGIVPKVVPHPSFGIWAENLDRKNGLNLGENLFIFFFFFGLHSSPKSGQKNGLSLSENLFLLVFLILKFPNSQTLSSIFLSKAREKCLVFALGG